MSLALCQLPWLVEGIASWSWHPGAQNVRRSDLPAGIGKHHVACMTCVGSAARRGIVCTVFLSSCWREL